MVEWELVDYGSGVFHVASYHESEVAPAAVVEAVREPVVTESNQAPECLVYRCWVALRDGCRAA